MSSPTAKIDLGGLQTESRNSRSAVIDRVPTQELCRILNREDSQIPAAVESCIPVIAEVIDALSARVRSGGRVFYIGAGTSGRLGVLDASEIPPTYSAPKDQFVALIAGGDYALRHAKEGAEDSRSEAAEDLAAFRVDPKVDSLIGIASSGRTPYVLGGLQYFKALGGVTVGIVCVSPSAIHDEGNTDHLVAAVTGPEVVTGSTRMKAGTATKLVLNMISTGIMIKLGKTYGNLMVDLKATNLKLIQRAKNIIRFIAGPACTQSDDELVALLRDCGGSVKLAAVAAALQMPVSEAEQRLSHNGGVLARVFEDERQKHRNSPPDECLVLCVDGGGTSCRAVIMSKDGAVGRGSAGPCNPSTIGIDAATSVISEAIDEAANSHEATRGRNFRSIQFTSVWIGIAGYDRPKLAQSIRAAIYEKLNMASRDRLKVTADIDLLPAAAATKSAFKSAIVVIAGTGSIVMGYERGDAGFDRTSRAGGWGHLLGDDGSGYAIGRQALRQALAAIDAYRMDLHDGASLDTLPPLVQAILAYFKTQISDFQPNDLLSAIVESDSAPSQNDQTLLSPISRISQVAKVVLQMATFDKDAQSIVDRSAASLAESVSLLVKARKIDPSTSTLILAGGLMQDEGYKRLLIDKIQDKSGSLQNIETVIDPALAGARSLLDPISPA